MRRFSILVTEIGVPEYELCQVDTNPDEIVMAAKATARAPRQQQLEVHRCPYPRQQ